MKSLITLALLATTITHSQKALAQAEINTGYKSKTYFNSGTTLHGGTLTLDLPDDGFRIPVTVMSGKGITSASVGLTYDMFNEVLLDLSDQIHWNVGGIVEYMNTGKNPNIIQELNKTVSLVLQNEFEIKTGSKRLSVSAYFDFDLTNWMRFQHSQDRVPDSYRKSFIQSHPGMDWQDRDNLMLDQLQSDNQKVSKTGAGLTLKIRIGKSAY